MTNLVISPHVPFTDIDGSPLNEGFIFIGEKDKDPTLFPVSVFWDEAKTQPVVQPIRTRNGFVVNDSVFSKIFIDQSNCSVLVKNKNQSIIYSVSDAPQFTSVSSAQGLVQTETSRAMAAEMALNTAIMSETSRATAAENLLQTQINANGIGNRAYKTYAEMVADVANIPAKSKVTVTNDSTPANNGDYQYDGSVFTKSTYDPVAQAKAYTDAYAASIDALMVNKNKVFPLRRITRNSISANTPRPEFNAGLLNSRVFGAIAGEVYRISIMQNGETANGTAQGIQLEVLLESNMETSGAATIINTRSSTNQLTLNYAKGGIQTVNLVPDSRQDLLFQFTFDVDYLNTIYGTAILSATTASAGYNFIIDKSLYVNQDRLNKIYNSNSITINKDKNFPFLSKNRGGVTSSANGYFTRAFLNVEVLGAEIGKYYRIAFFQNGNVAPDSDGYGWILEEFDAATYQTDGTATRLKYYTDDNGSNPVLQPNTGVQTVVIKSTLKPNIIFKITVDTSEFPPSGTAITAFNSGAAGYSWIIDPSCYLPISVPNQDLEVDLDQIYYTFDAATSQLSYAYRSGNRFYRVWFGPVGFNNLPNFYRVDRAEADVSLHNAVFTQIMATTTDFLPPLRFSAVNNGDSGTEISTGGNHGSDGASGGSQTARNKLFKVFVDGQLLTTTRSGYAKSLKGVLLNEIMAWNTITLGRYPIQQSFNIEFTGSGAKIAAKVAAMEEVNVTTDNGLQTITGGFNTSQIITNSQYSARKAFDNNATTGSSGPKSSFPNADALVLRHYANGDYATWTDRTFGIGDGRHVSAATHLIQIRGSTKFYSVQIYNTTVNLLQNQTYEYAGGYYWGETTADASYDSVFIKIERAVFVTNDAKEIVV